MQKVLVLQGILIAYLHENATAEYEKATNVRLSEEMLFCKAASLQMTSSE